MIWTDIYVDEKSQLNNVLGAISMSFGFSSQEMIITNNEEDLIIYSEKKIVFLAYKPEDFLGFNQVSIYLSDGVVGSLGNLIFAANQAKTPIILADEDNLDYDAFIKIDVNGAISKIKIPFA